MLLLRRAVTNLSFYSLRKPTRHRLEMIDEDKINRMGARWEASTLNDRRMLKNEIFKKLFVFSLRDQLKIFSFAQLTRVWNFKQNKIYIYRLVYFSDHIAIDKNFKRNIIYQLKLCHNQLLGRTFGEFPKKDRKFIFAKIFINIKIFWSLA